MLHGSLFSGIGGFDLAAEWMGWENVFHCEWNEFGQKVLNHYWPKADLFTDITKSNFKKYANRIDILTGGFPCQPYSTAGKRLGKEDARHLWPEMLRAIREIRPRWIVGENVRGLISWNGGLVFDEVLADLANEGYKAFPVVLPAASVNAPHRRDRIWFVAYANHIRGSQQDESSKQPRRAEAGATSQELVIKNPDSNGRGGNEREIQPGERKQRDLGAGDHERIPADDGKAGDAPDTGNTGLQGRQLNGALDQKGQELRQQSPG